MITIADAKKNLTAVLSLFFAAMIYSSLILSPSHMLIFFDKLFNHCLTTRFQNFMKDFITSNCRSSWLLYYITFFSLFLLVKSESM